jgi:GNAT superfamily N-acetyltransferase
MTTIRAATAADVDAIVAMGLRFQATTTYATHLRATDPTLRALATGLLANPDAAIWLAEQDGTPVGMIAAALYTQPMSGERIGSEICWWMDPSARGGRTALRLLRTAEQWATDCGAVIFQMMAPTPEVGALYERLAYAPIETHYMRRLQ